MLSIWMRSPSAQGSAKVSVFPVSWTAPLCFHRDRFSAVSAVLRSCSCQDPAPPFHPVYPPRRAVQASMSPAALGRWNEHPSRACD